MNGSLRCGAGIRRTMPAIASLLVLVVAGCSALHDGAGSSAADDRRIPASHFVYSPYKYVPLAFDERNGVIATSIGDVTTPLVVDGQSRLPAGVGAVTLAFATGECGSETWDGIDPDVLARMNVSALADAGVDYIVSTGGAAGTFSCETDAGMERFIARYASPRLLGLDFDIERGQSNGLLASLVQRIKVAKARHPALRISFTLATWAGSDGVASLNADGEHVIAAIRDAGLSDYYVNLMVMDYGEAIARNCVVVDGVCDMGRSAIHAAANLRARFGLPAERIELTPMIGVNDVVTNVFTLRDASVVAAFVRESGLGGMHFWSLDRDAPCPPGTAKAQASCSGVGARPHAFSETFARALR